MRSWQIVRVAGDKFRDLTLTNLTGMILGESRWNKMLASLLLVDTTPLIKNNMTWMIDVRSVDRLIISASRLTSVLDLP